MNQTNDLSQINPSRGIKMTVEMDVTIPQALTLQAMFEYWNRLSGIGASRQVVFYADGDGNFHPRCDIKYSEDLPELTDEMREISIIAGENGNHRYDFDPIAWMMTPK